MYNYLTSVYQEGDKRSMLISVIQALHFARHGIDIISKTPVSVSTFQGNYATQDTSVIYAPNIFGSEPHVAK
jgi:hypothetical protein